MNTISMKLQADELIRLALQEDISSEDVTTNSVMKEAVEGEVQLICKQDGIVAGLDVFKRVFELLDENTKTEFLCKDGDAVKKGQLMGTVTGDIRVLLSGERVALNYLQRMSGIATYTHTVSALLKGTKTKIRKSSLSWVASRSTVASPSSARSSPFRRCFGRSAAAAPKAAVSKRIASTVIWTTSAPRSANTIKQFVTGSHTLRPKRSRMPISASERNTGCFSKRSRNSPATSRNVSASTAATVHGTATINPSTICGLSCVRSIT